MAREARLWDWLSKARFVFKDDLHMHRIENTASPGMPDVEGFIDLQPPNKSPGKWQFWFELKSEMRPANMSTPIHFATRDKQVEWNRRRWILGGACYWLLQVGHAHDRSIYMLPGIDGAAIHKGLSEAELHHRSLIPLGANPCDVILKARR